MTEAQDGIMKRWVAALRSGEYKQGKGYLHTEFQGEHAFCCLGVLCELAAKDGVISEGKLRNASESEGILRCYAYGGDSTQGLPAAVEVWAGIKNRLGRFLTTGELAGMNDMGENFETIARIIESKPKGLFNE